MNDLEGEQLCGMDAETLAYNSGFFLRFVCNIDTKKIHTCVGSIPNDSIVGKSSITDFGFYQASDIDNICSFIQQLMPVKNPTKIRFSVYNQLLDCNIIHTLFIRPNASFECEFHVCFVEMAGEIFRSLVYVWQLREAEQRYRIKWVANDLTTKIMLYISEYDTLRFWTQGYSTKDMAELLRLSPHTINEYKQKLYEKFRTVSIYQLTRYARKEKFI